MGCTKVPETPWFLYILECADKTLYTGITTDVQRRFEQHENGQGAKYTKGRAPLKILYTEECENRSSASKRELEIKALSKQAKQALILSAAS